MTDYKSPKFPNWIFSLIYLLIVYFLLEFSIRIFGLIIWRVPFFKQENHILRYYPELKPFLEDQIPYRDKNSTRLLILGGSAVSENLCSLSSMIENESTLKKPLHVFSLARFAHNSFDSKIKISYLHDYFFDYVFVYHGINDTRTNNCPVNIFDIEYNHIDFYREVNILQKHAEINYTVLPYMLHWLFNQMLTKTHLIRTLPKEYFLANPKLLDKDLQHFSSKSSPELISLHQKINAHKNKIVYMDFSPADTTWLEMGRNIKSAKSFEKNINFIINITGTKGEKLILTPFAYYQPDNYSLDAFLDKKLDYAEQRWPTELYGLPSNVVKGIETHNRITQSLALKHPDVYLFNFPDSIDKSKLYFNDICHLAPAGCKKLGEILSHIVNSSDSSKIF